MTITPENMREAERLARDAQECLINGKYLSWQNFANWLAKILQAHDDAAKADPMLKEFLDQNEFFKLGYKKGLEAVPSQKAFEAITEKRIFDALRSYRCIHQGIDCGDGIEASPLADILTPKGEQSIKLGEEELGELSVHIATELELAEAELPAKAVVSPKTENSVDNEACCSETADKPALPETMRSADEWDEVMWDPDWNRVDFIRAVQQDVIRSAAGKPVLPEGWVAVPREATEQMARNGSAIHYGGRQDDNHPQDVLNRKIAHSFWKGMISASPPCPILTEAAVAEKARREALEEAAKLCEQGLHSGTDRNWERASKSNARFIRALITKPEAS